MSKNKTKDTLKSKIKVEITVPEIRIPKRTVVIEIEADRPGDVYKETRNQVKELEAQIEYICNSSKVKVRYGYEIAEAEIYMKYTQWYLSVREQFVSNLKLPKVTYNIVFGDTVHKGLYQTAIGRYNDLSRECKIKITTAELVNNGRLTEEGKVALNQVNEKGPKATGKRRILFIAKELLVAGPRLFQYRYISPTNTDATVKDDAGRSQCTDNAHIAYWLASKGLMVKDGDKYKWSDQAAQYIYDYRKLIAPSISNLKEYQISTFIFCLQKEDLVPYLTNENPYLKESAMWRFNELPN